MPCRLGPLIAFHAARADHAASTNRDLTPCATALAVRLSSLSGHRPRLQHTEPYSHLSRFPWSECHLSTPSGPSVLAPSQHGVLPLQAAKPRATQSTSLAAPPVLAMKAVP